jgi:hypothetical protein
MEEQSSTVLLALARLLKPVVRVLLHNKVSYATFDQIARRVFVEVADKDFGIEGRKQTNSRIAVVTGLSRKEVLRLKRESELGDEGLDKPFHRAARLVAMWQNDSPYAGMPGSPHALAFDGDTPSFSSLVHECGGDLTPRAMLDELRQAGVVDVDKNKVVTLKARSYVPGQDEAQIMRILGTDVADLAGTIAYNLEAPPDESRFQLKVSYDNLPRESLETFHQMVSESGHELLVEFDKWLRQKDRDANPDAGGTGRARAGVGIYYFQSDEDVEDSE